MPREYAGTDEEQTRAKVFLTARDGKAVRPNKFLAPVIAYLRWRDDGKYRKGQSWRADGRGGTTEHQITVTLASEDFESRLKPSRMRQFKRDLHELLAPKQTTLLQSFAAAPSSSAAHDRYAVLPSPAGALRFDSPQAPRQPQQGPTDRTHPVIVRIP